MVLGEMKMSKFKTLLKLMKNDPQKIGAALSDNFARTKISHVLPDGMYLKLRYKALMGKSLNLKDPKTFNEKLQWLKLYDRKIEYVQMVDKHEVKQYVSSVIGEEYLIPTLGVWKNVDDIEIDALPPQFVLKCTHDSGSVRICRDKETFDLEEAKRYLRQKLKENLFWWGREWPYKNVEPRIIAEKYMVDESGKELNDYKVMCFGGVPKLIQIHRGRFGNHTQNFYDAEWNSLDILQGCPKSDEILEKPEFLEEMLKLSGQLSAGIPQVRVDWYFAGNQLYFGELTFFDASGFYSFEPKEWNYHIGKWIHLPKKR